MKHWKLILFFLVAAFIAIVVYRGTVSTCPLPARPFPSHTFEWIDNKGWHGNGVRCVSSVNGGMMCTWREGYDQIANILSLIVIACAFAYAGRGWYKEGYRDGVEDTKSTTKGEAK